MSLKEQSTLHWVETVLTSPCPVLGLQTPDLSVFPLLSLVEESVLLHH